MSGEGAKFELARNIEHYLSVLSKLYAREGQRKKQEIIVNARVRVHEEWSYDNWNGGTFGHALYLALPESLYLGLVRQRDELQSEIKSDINKVHNVQSEFIDAVFLEMEAGVDENWRRESGLLAAGQRIIAPDTEKRIWGDDGFRVFFTHKSEVKAQTAELKKQLVQFGISCFVAHEDIHPTQEWQSEIENALYSMDALVALMTEGFHESLWTDQEVGFAFGRGIPIISIRLGRDPYGFIGKFQALTCSWDSAAKEVASLLVRHDRMLNSYIKAVENCRSFDQGNLLAQILPVIQQLSKGHASRLASAFNDNLEVRGSYGFSGRWPSPHGPGLASHLTRLTAQRYRVTKSGTIEVEA